MEFRYRAIDGARPSTTTDTTPTQPPNPTFSSLLAQSVPGCNVGSSEDHFRKVIQREIEKQQIRNEIIVAETARRRELINEVVKEMSIEREMAIRRVAETEMSLEDKLTMWITQRKLQNQNNNNNNNNIFRDKCSYSDPLMYTSPYSLVTTPMMQLPQFQQIPEATPVFGSNKDKSIVLNRPDHIGAKRKAEDTQTGLVRAKCRQEPHSLGSENKAEEIDLKAKLIPLGTGETVSSKLPPCLVKLGSGRKLESKPKPNFKFWCDICGVGTFSQTVMRNHELGKKHNTAIKKQNETTETDSPSSITTPPVSQSEAITVLVQNHQTSEKKKRLWCEICNIQTYSEQVMESHKLGKKHKALLEKQQKKPVAVLDTNPSEIFP